MPDLFDSRRRILVVEDEVLVAMLVKDMLTTLGHTVVGPVGQLDQAMKMARKETVDAAVLDVNLSGEMVYPAAEVLRERGIPLAFVTGYDSDTIIAAWQDCPTLEKPFNSDDLDQLLNRLWSHP